MAPHMIIHGTEGLSRDAIAAEMEGGGRFVVFQYCISCLVLTFRLRSDVYFLRQGERALGKRLAFAGISFLLGWWGIPWGPIHTLMTIASSLGGGDDVSEEVLSYLGLAESRLLGHMDAGGIARMLRRNRPAGQEEEGR